MDGGGKACLGTQHVDGLSAANPSGALQSLHRQGRVSLRSTHPYDPAIQFDTAQPYTPVRTADREIP
jgi:hypothetical protein